MSETTNRPEWVPENAGKEFTTYVMPPTDNVGIQVSPEMKIVKRKTLTNSEYIEGIINKDIVMLSKAITLVESNSVHHINQAQELLKSLLHSTGNSIRIGISGPPGAGKSTAIESLGTYLCNQGLRVAVLAIDPSSTLTKGSVLGDKTRMDILGREKNAYIRPSPSAGTLGGVARKTRETILLCEAAGFDVILIETVGVGQSEITVRSMVDFFWLVLIPGSGDELQGIKKGVVEISDMISINKADGDNMPSANRTKSSYQHAVGLLSSNTVGWKPVVNTFSALYNKGISDIWSIINNYIDVTKNNGFFEKRRKDQLLNWVTSMVESELVARFYRHPLVESVLPTVNSDVLSGEITATNAVSFLLSKYDSKYSEADGEK